jgi:hypothetical protein
MGGLANGPILEIFLLGLLPIVIIIFEFVYIYLGLTTKPTCPYSKFYSGSFCPFWVPTENPHLFNFGTEVFAH